MVYNLPKENLTSELGQVRLIRFALLAGAGNMEGSTEEQRWKNCVCFFLFRHTLQKNLTEKLCIEYLFHQLYFTIIYRKII